MEDKTAKWPISPPHASESTGKEEIYCAIWSDSLWLLLEKKCSSTVIKAENVGLLKTIVMAEGDFSIEPGSNMNEQFASVNI